MYLLPVTEAPLRHGFAVTPPPEGEARGAAAGSKAIPLSEGGGKMLGANSELLGSIKFETYFSAFFNEFANDRPSPL